MARSNNASATTIGDRNRVFGTTARLPHHNFVAPRDDSDLRQLGDDLLRLISPYFSRTISMRAVSFPGVRKLIACQTPTV